MVMFRRIIWPTEWPTDHFADRVCLHPRCDKEVLSFIDLRFFDPVGFR